MPPSPPPKKQKNQKITIDGKVTFHYPPAPGDSPAAPNNTSSQYPGCTASNSPYPLINRYQYFKTAPDTKIK